MKFSNKLFLTGLILAFSGWLLAWFLELGRIGFTIFIIGFILGVIGFVGSTFNNDTIDQLRGSKIGMRIGAGGFAVSVVGALLGIVLGETRFVLIVFYIGVVAIMVGVIVNFLCILKR